MKIRIASNIQSDSIVDGEGIRSIIWTQGCPHNCLGCHNPNTHPIKEGQLIELDNLKKEIKNLKGQTGITISGGEPFLQPKECLEIAKYVHELKMDVWCYTGFTFEQLLNLKNNDVLEFLKEIDVLVDGKFIIEEKSLNLKYRGSKNQRIINVKKSLKENRTITYRKYQTKKEIVYKKDKYLFT